VVEDRVGGACRDAERLAMRLGSEPTSRNEGYDRPVVADSGCEAVPHVPRSLTTMRIATALG
jgi:hypothetical protein